MKYIILSIILYMISCTSKTQKRIESQAEFPIDSIIGITKRPLDIVKVHEIDIEKLYKIDSLFFNRFLEGLTINDQDTMKLRWDYQPFWYFFDHRDLGDKIMFSILSDNESGYSLLYYLIVDKISKEILSVNNLAKYEGDGDYYNIDSLIWFNNKFTLYTISGGSEYLNDSLAIQFQDSLCYEYTLSKYKFDSKKIFEYSNIDTIDTRMKVN